MMSNIFMSVETTLLLSVAALYIVHCPFNKVEESFNTQAVHDFINIFPNNVPFNVQSIPNDTSHTEVAIRSQLPWDHTQYPGVVARTFIGAIMVGLPMRVAKYLMLNGPMSFSQESDTSSEDTDLTSQFILQIGARFALSSFVVLSLSAITRALQKRYGLSFRICFLIITISQFHYMFYAGRFLPNTFATILANLVFAAWINRQYSKSIIYIAISVVIFRFDTALFFGILLFDAIFIRRFLSLSKVLKVGVPAGCMALAATFAVDTYFWGRPVWPEYESFYFNVWLNKSHEWGTQPIYYYIYDCIPRMMMFSSPLLFVAEHRITRDYLIPTLFFMGAYSLLPHKELRFVLFVNPLLNISAASSLLTIYHYMNETFCFIGSLLRKPPVQSRRTAVKMEAKRRMAGAKIERSYIAGLVFCLGFLIMFLMNLTGCYIGSTVSSHNYPGGRAAISLAMTKELVDRAQKSTVMDKDTGLQDPRSDVAVYVNNLAAQSGVSRFLQVDGAYYAKTPKLDEATFRKSYSLIYLVLEPREVTKFVRSYCPPSINHQELVEQGLDKWRQNDTELKCVLPNQEQMFCSIIDSTTGLRSVDMSHSRILQHMTSITSFMELLDEDSYIRTKVALHTLRCSTRSKFNPFAE